MRLHFRLRTALILLGAIVVAPASAGPTWTTGHINNITVAGGDVMLQTDSPLPDNCVGSAYGWLMIPGSHAATASLVLGLWLRGDITSVLVNVYTIGLVAGYCQINQIDPITPQ